MRRFIALLPALLCVAMLWGQNSKSERIVTIDGGKYYLHTVVPKETFYSLSRTYDITVDEIRASNPGTESLKIGDVMKIPVGEKQTTAVSGIFRKHKVVSEDTLYSIARKYGVSVDVLIADNPGIDVSALKIGSRLNIRKNAIGSTTGTNIDRQIENVAQDVSNVSDEYVLHVAVAGETLYSLGRKYGVAVEEIEALNGLQNGVVKAGAMIKIPKKRASDDMTEETAMTEETVDESTEPADNVTIGHYRGGAMNVSLLLPLTDNSSSRVRSSFVEFYQGILLALEDLKKEGCSVNLNLYDTQNSADRVEGIVNNDNAFSESDLIIGPVYERNSEAAVKFARRKGVVMVSPLASVEGGYGNMFYQLSPATKYKNEKLKSIFEGDKHIIFISAGAKDETTEREMTEAIGGKPYTTVVYSEGVNLEHYLVTGKENIYVVTSSNETDTEKVLAAISSMHNNRVARSMNDAPIKVIGNSRWLRYSNIEKNLFFKLDVSLITSYHADISNHTIKAFDNRYLQAFGNFPTLYSYRGYDAMTLFAEAYFGSRNESFGEALEKRETAPLQVPYKFVYENGKYVNTQWTLLTYKSDYTIEIK